MPSYLVSNADKSINVSHVEAKDAATAIAAVAEATEADAKTLKAVDHVKIEAEYWAKMSPSAAKAVVEDDEA